MGTAVLGRRASPRFGVVSLLSVVLVNAGRDSDLLSCCASLARQQTKVPLELLVVATPTAPEIRARVTRLFPATEWLPVSRFGVAAMRNRGLERARGDVVLFLDTDTRLLPGALDELYGAFGRHGRLGVAGAKLVSPDGSLQSSARRFYTLRTMVLRRVPGRLAAGTEAVRSHLLADWSHDDERTVDWVVGACFAVRRAAVRDVGLFSEDSAFGFEDVDWCFRARVEGWETRYVPTAVVVHEYVRSSAGLNRRTASHVYAALRFFLRSRRLVAHAAGNGR